jgi:hypothetical protein
MSPNVACRASYITEATDILEDADASLKSVVGVNRGTILKEHRGLWLVASYCRYCGGRGIRKKINVVRTHQSHLVSQIHTIRDVLIQGKLLCKASYLLRRYLQLLNLGTENSFVVIQKR